MRVSLGALNIRLEEHKLCLLVMIGVRADGRKELVALADGYRESVESWADLLRDGNAAACAPRSSRSVTARSGSGARCATPQLSGLLMAITRLSSICSGCRRRAERLGQCRGVHVYAAV